MYVCVQHATSMVQARKLSTRRGSKKILPTDSQGIGQQRRQLIAQHSLERGSLAEEEEDEGSEGDDDEDERSGEGANDFRRSQESTNVTDPDLDASKQKDCNGGGPWDGGGRDSAALIRKSSVDQEHSPPTPEAAVAAAAAATTAAATITTEPTIANIRSGRALQNSSDGTASAAPAAAAATTPSTSHVSAFSSPSGSSSTTKTKNPLESRKASSPKDIGPGGGGAAAAATAGTDGRLSEVQYGLGSPTTTTATPAVATPIMSLSSRATTSTPMLGVAGAGTGGWVGKPREGGQPERAMGNISGIADATVGKGVTRAAGVKLVVSPKVERESVFLDEEASAAAVAAGGAAKGSGAAGGIGVLPLPSTAHWPKHGVSGSRDLYPRPLNAIYCTGHRRYHVLTCIEVMTSLSITVHICHANLESS